MRADKLRNKEKIMEKAGEIMAGSNIDSISLEEIATAAEVTRATIYNHFSSKEELLKEMVLPALDFATKDLLERNKKAVPLFSDITDVLFNLYREYRETIELVSCHSLYGNSDVVSAHSRFLEQFQKLMISARPEGYTLGLELSMRLISGIYLPVLKEIHKNYGIKNENRNELNLQFREIIQGALLI